MPTYGHYKYLKGSKAVSLRRRGLGTRRIVQIASGARKSVPWAVSNTSLFME
jgi:hypothetical protein